MAVQKFSKEAKDNKRQIKRKQDALEQSMQDEVINGKHKTRPIYAGNTLWKAYPGWLAQVEGLPTIE
ncbi:hypothetical protein TNCV_5140151 [Trichonephila clavipes]|nr:hypothetical protein TNCV_5140151 [Trichonephila clavipes]